MYCTLVVFYFIKFKAITIAEFPRYEICRTSSSADFKEVWQRLTDSPLATKHFKWYDFIKLNYCKVMEQKCSQIKEKFTTIWRNNKDLPSWKLYLWWMERSHPPMSEILMSCPDTCVVCASHIIWSQLLYAKPTFTTAQVTPYTRCLCKQAKVN